jgi:hypothetical protein
MIDVIYNNAALAIIKEKYPGLQSEHIPNRSLPERVLIEVKTEEEEYYAFLNKSGIEGFSFGYLFRGIRGCLDDRLDEFSEMED